MWMWYPTVNIHYSEAFTEILFGLLELYIAFGRKKEKKKKKLLYFNSCISHFRTFFFFFFKHRNTRCQKNRKEMWKVKQGGSQILIYRNWPVLQRKGLESQYLQAGHHSEILRITQHETSQSFSQIRNRKCRPLTGHCGS